MSPVFSTGWVLAWMLLGSGQESRLPGDSISHPISHPVSGLVHFQEEPLGGVPIGINLFQNGFRTVMTGPDGRFRIDLPEGPALFHVGPDWDRGLAQAPNREMAIRGPLSDLDFELQRGFPIRGRTLDASGEPRQMPGNLACPQRRENYGLGSDPEGNFEIILSSGQYIFSFHLPGTDQEAIDMVKVLDRGISHLVIQARDRSSILPDPPVSLDRLEISIPGPDGMAEVSGRPGAVPGGHTVVIHQLSTCETLLTEAARDGSFHCRIFAPWGSYLQVGSRPVSERFAETMEIPPHPGAGPAWVIYRRRPGKSGEDEPLHGALRAGSRKFFFTGMLAQRTLHPGGRLHIRGSLVLSGSKDRGESGLQGEVRFFFHRLFDEKGRQLTPVRILASSYLTPTGLPIEGVEGTSMGEASAEISWWKGRPSSRGLSWPVEVDLYLPPNVPPGIYALAWRVSLREEERGPVRFFQEVQEFRGETLHIFPVENPAPPRLLWTLFSGLSSGGSRALLPREAEGNGGLAPAAVFRPREFVAPWRDARSGKPVPYRLEPGLPFVSRANRPFPLTVSTPTIPFDLPGGELRVAIQGPRGFQKDLGPVPFLGGQNSLSTCHPNRANPALGHRRFGLAFGNNYLSEIYELTTSSKEFELCLPAPGRYEVRVDGWIEDCFGNRYRGGGTYSFLAGEPLLLETAEFPGTPHEVGDGFTPSVQVLPPLPAEMEGEFLFLPESNPHRAVRRPVRGRANRFGWFSAEEGFRFDEPGEYRLDLTASHRDSDGMLWAGAICSASVCAEPDTPIRGRGERGVRCPGSTNRPAWFIEGLSPDIVRNPGEGFHAPFPYFSSDVLWLRDHESIFPTVTCIDRDGRFAGLIERYHRDIHHGMYSGLFNYELLPIDMRSIGELPVVGAGRWPAGQVPESRELHGYTYSTSVRPGVQVRSIVQELTPVAYWSIDDSYNLQPGAGPEGDLPGDFKALFGGIVIRHPESRTTGYGIYGSMAVIVGEGDRLGNRVTPPFRGRPGGPDGGPLLVARGREHDLFVTLRGVRPGTVLEVGDRIELAGLAWPLISVEVALDIEEPHGKQKSLRLHSNGIGAFQDPSASLPARVPGRHVARVSATARGRTSAGPLQEPYPTGDLPGTEDGRFSFFVVPKKSPPLEVSVKEISFREGARLELEGTLPADFETCEAWVTLRFPGYVLEDRRLEVLTLKNGNNRFSYVLDAPRLREDFPNIDREPVDIFDLTFYAKGRARGKTHHRVQKVLVQGKRVFIGSREVRQGE